MKIDLQIDETIYLSKSSPEDKEALVTYLNDEELYNQTLRIPQPYTEKDAENNLNFILNFEAENAIRKNWAIRNHSHELMGHVGLHFTHGINSPIGEIYYWIGKPHRNKGIITKVVKEFTNYCFTHLNYSRIEAPIFDFNIGSEQVLIKSGYTFEQLLPNHYTKAEKTISAKMYAKTRKV
jgi:ribosomal-protein-alanine N-acetyltransferase